MSKLTHADLVPGRKVRADAKEVRRFVLELGDVVDLYFYNGKDYRVKWKSCGLGLAEIWLAARGAIDGSGAMERSSK